MYTEVELAPEVRDFLEALDVPVRVLDGAAARRIVSRSWRGHARHSGARLEECQARGLTVVSWGSDHDPTENGGEQFAYVPYLPAELYTHGQDIRISREFLADARRDEKSYTPECASWPTHPTLARVNAEHRVVWFNFRLTTYEGGGLNYANVDMYKILGDPIQRALVGENLPRVTEAAKRLFIEAVTRESQSGVQRTEQQIEGHRNNIQAWAEHIRGAYSEMSKLESELAIRRRVTKVCGRRLEERWDAFVNHPKLARVTDDGSALILRTVPLDCENPHTGESNYLGIIEIRLTRGGYGFSVTMKNVDNAKNYDGDPWAHPHCPQNGSPCWGGAEHVASDLLASYNLPALIEFLIQYLESYNPNDSWGRNHAYLWELSEEGSGYDDEEDECVCAECVREREHEMAEAGA